MDRFEEVKLRIKEQVDLVDLVGDYVVLKPRGRYAMGLCPFHQEKTPSFAVYSDSQHFRCFGCGKAGDVFSFLMEREGLSFRESMERLADKAGVSLDGVFSKGRGTSSRDPGFAHLRKVNDWFRHILQTAEGEAGRAYLEERGLSDAIEGFGLGFHPRGGGLARFAEAQKIPRGVLQKAGLLGDDDYERFAGRLMFPILDDRGRTVGFGGRVLGASGERAKYLNSPESPLFNKRRLLFGLRQAKQAGVRQLVVMEGYTDVIAAHLAGFQGAVATLGTALTADHARLLERFATGGVVLLFDGDTAGHQAAERAFRELANTRLKVHIAVLEPGSDPADLVAARPGRDAEEVAQGRDRLSEILAGGEEALTVWFRLLRKRLDLTLDVGIAQATEECAQVLRNVEDPVRREAMQDRMAQHLGVSLAAFRKSLSLKPQRKVAQAAAEAGAEDEAWAGMEVQARPRPRRASPMEATEQDLLACLIAEPGLLAELGDLVPDTPLHKDLLSLLQEGRERGNSTKPKMLGYLFMRCAEHPELSQLLGACEGRSQHIKSPPDTLSRIRQDLGVHSRRQEAQNIRYRLQEARANGDQALVEELTKAYVESLRSQG